jgi:hypothetical protein
LALATGGNKAQKIHQSNKWRETKNRNKTNTKSTIKQFHKSRAKKASQGILRSDGYLPRYAFHPFNRYIIHFAIRKTKGAWRTPSNSCANPSFFKQFFNHF